MHVVLPIPCTVIYILEQLFGQLTLKVLCIRYFSTLTSIQQGLKNWNFCSFMEIENEQIIGSAEAKWLSLEPIVNRIIKMCKELGSYFMSHERCPTIFYAI
jgi:hypothetical protein